MAPRVQPREVARLLAEEMHRACLGTRVGRLHRQVARRFETALRPLGLTLSQMEVLAALTVVGGPVKPAFIAGRLAVERSTMSRNLTLMEAKGLVTTTDTSATGRSLAVSITDHGTETLARATDAWTAAQSAVIDLLGPEAPSLLDTWLADLTPMSRS